MTENRLIETKAQPKCIENATDETEGYMLGVNISTPIKFNNFNTDKYKNANTLIIGALNNNEYKHDKKKVKRGKNAKRPDKAS